MNNAARCSKRLGAVVGLMTLAVFGPTMHAERAETVFDAMAEWDRAHPYRQVRQYIFSGGESRYLDSITRLGDFGTEGYLRVTSEHAEYWLVNTPEHSFVYFPLSGVVGTAPTTSVRETRSGGESAQGFMALATRAELTNEDEHRVLTLHWNVAEAAKLGICRANARSASRTYRVREDGFVTDVIDLEDDLMTRMSFEIVALGRAAVERQMPRLPIEPDAKPIPFQDALQWDIRIRQGMEQN